MTLRVSAELLYGEIGNDICSPFFDPSGNLHLVLQSSGSIITFSKSGKLEIVHVTGGQPSGAIFDDKGGILVADTALNAILVVNNQRRQDVVVAAYEDKPLKGPNSIIMTSNALYFTDSGPFGDTGLHRPHGSIFSIVNSPSGQILKPISLENLAYPSGLAMNHEKTLLYVAETMTNRIIRYFQQPDGVFHGSVFCHLSGIVGPTALTVDDYGRLYVGAYDIRASSAEGSVFVYSKSAVLLATITVPGPEISGLSISGKKLFITEKSTGSIYTSPIYAYLEK